MKKNKRTALSITAQTIRNLTGPDMDRVAGGATLNCEKTQLNCPSGATCGVVASCAGAGCQAPTLTC